jgi:uroporphyrinogen-III synthase
MSDPLKGRRIVIPETRERDLFAAMLAARGAIPIACPLVAIRDAPDPAPVEAWLRRFIADPPDHLVLLTGEGLRRLIGFAERAAVRGDFIATLAHPRKFARGPKPVRALREIGLDSDQVAANPTTAGVIDLLKAIDLSGRRVGAQLYPDSDHRELLAFLSAAGAVTDIVLPYVYASEADEELALAIIGQMARGEVDAIAFTSAPQVRRLRDIAAKAGRGEEARDGLARVLVAAIGPVVAAELAAMGIRPDVTPANETYFMKPLVRALEEAFAKRGGTGE